MEFKEFEEVSALYQPMIDVVYSEGQRYFKDLFRYWDEEACGMSMIDFLKKFKSWDSYGAYQWASCMDWTKYPEFSCPDIATKKILDALYNSDDPIIIEFAERLDMAYIKGVKDGFTFEVHLFNISNQKGA